MRYAILCPPAVGHLNPFSSLADELKMRGHTVIFYQLSDYADWIRARGHEVRVFGQSVFPPGAWNKSSEKMGLLRGTAATNHYVHLMEMKTASALEELPALLAADSIEAIVADQVGLESSTVAELLGIPFATVCNAIPLDTDPSSPPFFTTWGPAVGPFARARNRLAYALFERKVRPALELVNKFRRRRSLPPLRNRAASYSRRLKLIRLSEELDFPRALAPHTHWIGPMVQTGGPSAFPWSELNGMPLVYVSMGSEVNRDMSVFQNVIDAIESEPVQLVIALGRKGASTDGVRRSAGTLVVDFAPQPELLARASLFVTHAGVNSALEAACAGVPMLALPCTNDQFGMAARIENAGIGTFLAPRQRSAALLRNAFRAVHGNPAFTERARALASRLSPAAAASKAAGLIESNL